MNTLTLIVNAYDFLNSPIGHVVIAAALAASSGLGAYVVTTQPSARDLAQDIADLEAEIEPLVVQAEATFLRGDNRYSIVLNRAEAWLKAQGIKGRKGRLLKKYLPVLIEAAVKRVDPKMGPKKAA